LDTQAKEQHREHERKTSPLGSCAAQGTPTKELSGAMAPKAARHNMDGHIDRVAALRKQRETARLELLSFRKELKQEPACHRVRFYLATVGPCLLCA
jgi:hypothetical protein